MIRFVIKRVIQFKHRVMFQGGRSGYPLNSGIKKFG
jgi:hypothetical protein